MENNLFTEKDNSMVDFLLIFYKINRRLDIFSEIIKQNTPLSLRLLDWLVTNYSKKYNISYIINNKKQNQHFNIYLDYKNQLKAYSKKYFDPFCRQKRITINLKNLNWKPHYGEIINEEHLLLTTIGQLNFFKWFIENKILEFALNNISFIDEDMTLTYKNKDRGKRCVLSPVGVKGVCFSNKEITLNFKY